MAKFTVDAKGFTRLFLGKERARLRRVETASLEAATLGAELVAREAPVDVGSIKGSIHARARGKGAEILVDAPHAVAVEAGARPHRPPLQPLVDWVRRHRASFGIAESRKLRPVMHRLYGAAASARARAEARAAKIDQDIERVARAIQSKIAKYGTRPRWFMRRQLPRLREILDKVIKRRIRDR